MIARPMPDLPAPDHQPSTRVLEALPAGWEGTPSSTAPHDGLLLLAALTGNQALLRAWLRVENERTAATTSR
jgi:hypothetical protein